jgi:predicted DNA-binding transcriptional regulator YafY
MDSPTTRVLALLELLQSADERPGAELAQRLGVDARTLRRYVTQLKALGVPVVSVRGRHGAYGLRPGAKLPPLMFSNAEAVALSVGLLFAQRMGLSDTTQGARTAQTKLERVMPVALQSQLRALGQAVQLELAPPVGLIDAEVLLALSHATAQRQRVHLHYQAGAVASGVDTWRDLDCYGLAWRSGRWYAVGWCHLRAGLRAFRLDRIVALQVLPRHFAPPQDFDAVRHLAVGLASMPRKHAITVLLHATLAQAQAGVFSALGLLQPVPEGVLLHAQADDLDWFARQLAALPFDFAVQAPDALRVALKDGAKRLQRLSQAPKPQKTREKYQRP